MKNAILILLIFAVGFVMPDGVLAQSDTLLQIQQQQFIPGRYSQIAVDNLTNIYAISRSGNQIKKMKSNGDSIAVFNDVKQYGNIYGMDITNPLKIMLYYKDFATILSLDRFLNNINKVDLRQVGILQAGVVCQSYDNQFWVFDQQEYKLKKISDDGTVSFTSDDFRILFSNPVNPTQIIDRDGSLYLYDPQVGWCIMDYYGAVKGQYPYKNWKTVGVRDGLLFGWQGSHLIVFNPNNFNLNSYTISLDLKEINDILLVGDNIYTVQKTGITVYRYHLN